MYTVVTTKKYRKALKKLIKSGQKTEIKDLEQVVNTLKVGKKLSKKHQDHALTGDLAGFRECHIKDDFLLVYYKKEKELVLVLARLGSHDDLF